LSCSGQANAFGTFKGTLDIKNDKSGLAVQAISTQYLVSAISKNTIFSVFSCFSGDSAVTEPY
jgi:hypothetical protein